MVEGSEHFVKQWRCFAALIRCMEHASDCLQSDVGASTFVRDWKAISAEAEFAATDQPDADRADHRDTPLIPR
jgi:hypothetical protein